MHIRIFILFLMGSLSACELPPQTEVYNYAFEMNEFEDFPLGWTYERGLPTSITKRYDSINEVYKPILSAEIENPVILSQKVILKDSGDYFIFGKIAANVDKGNYFISVETENAKKGVRYDNDFITCSRAFFTLHIEQSTVVTLRTGFEQDSRGIAFPDTLFFLKVDYLKPLSIDARQMRKDMEQLAGVDNFRDELDGNVEKFASMINSMFTPGAASEQAFNLFQSTEFDVEQTSYLHEYALEGPPESFRAFNLKSSVALDEILKLYRIPVRQIYLQDECFTLHQFIEYWNDQDGKWKIIDPAYGVRYQREGDYLSFEEVQQESLEHQLDSNYITPVIETSRRISDQEIVELWGQSATLRTIVK